MGNQESSFTSKGPARGGNFASVQSSHGSVTRGSGMATVQSHAMSSGSRSIGVSSTGPSSGGAFAAAQSSLGDIARGGSMATLQSRGMGGRPKR